MSWCSPSWEMAQHLNQHATSWNCLSCLYEDDGTWSEVEWNNSKHWRNRQIFIWKLIEGGLGECPGNFISRQIQHPHHPICIAKFIGMRETFRQFPAQYFWYSSHFGNIGQIIWAFPPSNYHRDIHKWYNCLPYEEANTNWFRWFSPARALITTVVHKIFPPYWPLMKLSDR